MPRGKRTPTWDAADGGVMTVNAVTNTVDTGLATVTADFSTTTSDAAPDTEAIGVERGVAGGHWGRSPVADVFDGYKVGASADPEMLSTM